jgi:hypothetical protein
MHDASSKKTDDAYPFWFLLDGSSTCIALLDLQLHVIGGNAGFAEALRWSQVWGLGGVCGVSVQSGRLCGR